MRAGAGRSIWSVRDRDLAVAGGTAVLCALGILGVNVVAVRVALALPLCFLLPGYVLQAGLFCAPGIEQRYRVMLVPALSLAVLVLGALLLNLLPGIGLRRSSWALLLLAVVLAGALWARHARDSVTQAVVRERSAAAPADDQGAPARG